MDHADKFLAKKYSEYRTYLRKIEPCTPFMPYKWFKPPQTIRLDAEFGRQQMVYRDQADDAARDLANGINHLIGLTMRLEAWQAVLEGLDLSQKSDLLHEFVQDLASAGLLAPYTLKQRCYFAIAHLSHQANCVQQGEQWSDDFVTLPEDWEIDEKVAARLTKPCRSWKRLIKALNKVDVGDYKTATGDFRSKHTHRFTPRVELGMTQMMKRLPSKNAGKPCYGMGGSDPIKLETVVHELKTQCVSLSKCYREFQALVGEQSTALYGEVCT
ncbi:hypothetical protein FP026_03015 [Rhizobium tropici]|uniref:Integrase n=1 Tax=Rhizobium tropici TaxID=398 RepID=A0A5B0WBV5_RHITR|nr:hypothetical protein [Rhizobium tropici]KAA1184376.1 hypothetical protein FP026_03015 [Rhizobium tropici]